MLQIRYNMQREDITLTYGRCEIINWPDFNNEIHALPEQISKQDAAMTYNGSLYIDKKLGTDRFGKYEADLKHCTCPSFVKDGLPCMHMYLIAFYSKAIKINRFLHFTK